MQEDALEIASAMQTDGASKGEWLCAPACDGQARASLAPCAAHAGPDVMGLLAIFDDPL